MESRAENALNFSCCDITTARNTTKRTSGSRQAETVSNSNAAVVDVLPHNTCLSAARSPSGSPASPEPRPASSPPSETSTRKRNQRVFFVNKNGALNCEYRTLWYDYTKCRGAECFCVLGETPASGAARERLQLSTKTLRYL